VPSLFSAGFCFLHLIAANTSHEETLGQDNLREKWAEASKDSRTYSDFKTQHFFVDVAEDHWANYVRKKSVRDGDTFSSDIQVAGYEARQAFAESPWNVKLCVDALFNYLGTIFERTLDAAGEVTGWADSLIPPLAISLLLLLTLHLWVWAPAICKSIPRWIGSRSKLVLLAILVTTYLWTAYTGFWGATCFLFLCATIIYSREKTISLSGAIVLAVYFNIRVLGAILLASFTHFAPHEALDLGRTRLEYSVSALDALSPIERALWANYNGDKQSADHWLEKAPASKEKAIIELNFLENAVTAPTLLPRYEELRKTYGDDPVILFNLSQLYIRSQQLVQSDGLRSSLNPTFYAIATARTTAMNRLLLPPSIVDLHSRIQMEIGNRIQQWLKRLGFYPFLPILGILSLLGFLIPWMVIALALALRPKAAGLCIHTGEPSVSPDLAYSNLYQTVSQKRDTSHPTLRQRLDLLIRRNNQIQHYQLKRWRWFFPGAASLILDQSLAAAFSKTFLPAFFLWNTLSITSRVWLMEFVRCEPATHIHPASLSLGFLVLFLATYGFLLSQNMARSNT
jgi:hypothetical protein